jgi:quercetin dioxygenase-like cupin family protein
MNEFPEFMRNQLNKVDPRMQYTPGVEGYVFDGIDSSQLTFWTYTQDAASKQHSHEYDEYTMVVQGQYTVIIDNKRYILNPGDEFIVKKGIQHGGEAIAGTRTFNAFGGRRAKREVENQ